MRFTQPTPKSILFFWIIANLLIGLVIVPDFGVSTDEHMEDLKAQPALAMYTGNISQDPVQDFAQAGFIHDKYYGTANTVLIEFVEQYLFPNSNHSTRVVAHYCYFIYFQLAVLAMFSLASFFFNQWTSLAVALLFATQPLLIGHAFINPKDIPLLATFLLAVSAGFWMVRQWVETETSQVDLAQTPVSWPAQRRFLVILLVLFVLLWSTPHLVDGLKLLVTYSYQTGDTSMLGRLFDAATSSGSLEGYQILAQRYFFRVFRWVILVVPTVLALMFSRAEKQHLFDRKVTKFALLAASALGWALSTRSLAIAAGGLVGLYGILKLGRKALLPMTIYALTASLVSFISWPFLWLNGIKSYFQGLLYFSSFPWYGQVLFDGLYYPATELPWLYIPQLMAIQLTLPLVILAGAGFFLSLILLVKQKIEAYAWLLIYGWFVLPILYTVFGSPTLYNNFRQFLFVTPPLFLMAGLVIEWGKKMIGSKVLYAILVIGLIIPGVYWSARLHPLQYVYYNALVGNVAGAGERYQLDYYNVSYILAMDYVIDHIPEESKILMWKDNWLGKTYSGDKDYIFEGHTNVPSEDYILYDYAIMPAGMYTGFFEAYSVIHSVVVEGQVLLDIIALGPPDP
jgi:hypothetical protein